MSRTVRTQDALLAACDHILTHLRACVYVVFVFVRDAEA